MKKIFISQPMKDRTDEQILEERNRIASIVETVLEEPVEVIDSFLKDSPHETLPLWRLGKSIQLMSTADIVVFNGRWNKYRGCSIEHECAVQYGMRILEIAHVE